MFAFNNNVFLAQSSQRFFKQFAVFKLAKAFDSVESSISLSKDFKVFPKNDKNGIVSNFL